MFTDSPVCRIHTKHKDDHLFMMLVQKYMLKEKQEVPVVGYVKMDTRLLNSDVVPVDLRSNKLHHSRNMI
jgi:hypothetical protein